MAHIAKINEAIESLHNAEKITKVILSELSRSVLEYICVDTNDGKASEDSQVANRLIGVLTPVNRKVAIEFFTRMLPFHVASGEDGEFVAFGKKDKKAWEKKHDTIVEFLADPHANIWTWAERNIELVAKSMTFDKLNQAMGQLIKKATKANLGKNHVVQAMLANGISMEDIMVVIKTAIVEQPEPEDKQEQEPA